MAHLIDKDALVAEIEKRLHQLTDAAFDSMIGRNLIEIKDFIDTLEVKEVDEELQGIEKEVAEGCVARINRKRIPINLKGEIKAKFKNEFHTIWQTVGEIQFAKVAKHIVESMCLHFATWGAYNLKDYVGMSDEEKAKMDKSEIDFEQELYNYFGQVKDFTLGMRIAKRFYDMGKNSQEPVSEDLEKAAVEAFKQIVDSDKNSFLEIFKAGAGWQKEQFEKNRLEHCDSITEEQYNLEVGFIDQHLDKYNRMPTFLDAIEYGMEKIKEQMMKDAEDLVVGIDANGLACVNVDGVLPDDTVRVLVIKED